MTKIDIFSGFLGAGKTTLIKKLIKEAFPDEKVVLIENEFGEINIDSGFLKDAGVEITEMSSGCICCTLVGDFAQALRSVAEQFSPDRILIEPSGVGKLSDVIRAVRGAEADLPITLNSFVTVADAKKCRLYSKNFGEFYLDQIENAKTIILSRTGDMKEDRLKACIDIIRAHNEKARIITTPWDQLTGAQILETMEGDKTLADELLEELAKKPAHEHHHEHDHRHGDDSCSCGHDHHDHHHEHDHRHEDDSCSCVTTITIIITNMTTATETIPAPAVMIITIIIMTTMQTKSSPAGEQRQHTDIRRTNSPRLSRNSISA